MGASQRAPAVVRLAVRTPFNQFRLHLALRCNHIGLMRLTEIRTTQLGVEHSRCLFHDGEGLLVKSGDANLIWLKKFQSRKQASPLSHDLIELSHYAALRLGPILGCRNVLGEDHHFPVFVLFQFDMPTLLAQVFDQFGNCRPWGGVHPSPSRIVFVVCHRSPVLNCSYTAALPCAMVRPARRQVFVTHSSGLRPSVAGFLRRNFASSALWSQSLFILPLEVSHERCDPAFREIVSAVIAADFLGY